MKKFIEKLKNKQNLSFDESKAAFEILMEGKASDDEIFNFLTLLSIKGEVADEIAGGVYVLRSKSKRVNVKDCVDTCGTGGDGMNTLNISTASALLPCFATLTPMLDSNNAEAVEIFNVFIPSPPVPQVSTQSLTLTLLDLSLKT